MGKGESIAEAFVCVCDVFSVLHPGKAFMDFKGCWERQIGHYHLSVNGHKTPQKNREGIEVEPYNCYITFNGWPAGILNPYGGAVMCGSLCNEDDFIKTLKDKYQIIQALMN